MFDFAANRTIASFEAAAVPPQFQCFYVENATGGFDLAATPQVIAAVEAISGQSNALKASRLEAREAKGKLVDLSPLAEYGTDPVAIAASIKEKNEEYTTEIAKGKGASLDLTKLREAMGQEHATQMAAKDVVISNQEKQIHKELVTNRATAAIVAAKGTPLLLMPHLDESVKTVMNEKGEYEVHVVDKEGARRFSGHTAAHMTVEELVVEMKGKEEFGVCFKSEAPAGGGAPPTTGTRPRPQAGELSPQQKISAGLDKRRT